MYLQSIHLTRLLSRLITVKPQQSEWLNTWLLSAECGSTLKPCRVASAELNVYPYIIPATLPVRKVFAVKHPNFKWRDKIIVIREILLIPLLGTYLYHGHGHKPDMSINLNYHPCHLPPTLNPFQ